MSKIKWLVVALLLASLRLGISAHAHADVNNFVINNFVGDYTLTTNDPQGELKVKEEIDVTFTDQNHGILRAIPEKYKNYNEHIKDIHVSKADGSTWSFTTYSQGNNLVLKIGDPNQTVTGKQTFIVRYTLQNVVTFYNDHDELYWDINGDQWAQPFEKVNATFHLPAASLTEPAKLACYSGSFGQSTSNCTIQKTTETSVSVDTTQALAPSQTLTSVISLKPGIFHAQTSRDTLNDYKQSLRDHLLQISLIVFLPLVTLVFMWLVWFTKGRDPKGRGVIIPQYDAPDGLKPAMVGTIMDFKLDSRDISATIIDLAIRKYIKIVETEKKVLVKTTKKYSFILLNTDYSALQTHEKEIMYGIFGIEPPFVANTEVSLDSLNKKFYRTANTVTTQVESDLTTGGYFASNPLSVGKIWGGVGSIAIVAIFFFRSFYLVGILIAGIIIHIFAGIMSKRTVKGVEAKERIEGLKMYLEVAEADRIKMLQSPDSPYADRGNQPKQTVELFEKLLPYAIALKVENAWAKQFKNIYTTPPDWYSGNWNTFNTVYFASALSSSVNAMGSNFSPPSSSGGSGFGGGGFSGGGGGGGGGGGW